MTEEVYDVCVIGGGPAGMAAALKAHREGVRVLLAEREARLGGILKQCIHDGFGLVRFGEKMAGPEYAQYFVDEIEKEGVEVSLLTFVTRIEKNEESFGITLVSSRGMRRIHSKSIVLSTGCRERTARQVSIHGTRPAGVYTAGTAQYYTNILGLLPAKNCVILGSGDIGLIMARRLTLEGANVLGVYEAKPSPSGLMRNISQCLYDFDIPLHTSTTVTRVFGADRLTGVEIAKVDEKMQPISGTQEHIECDSLIISVGLIPENELAESLGILLDKKTKGPIVDQNYMTVQSGVFVCGNALHVNDLVDYVSESGEGAGYAAAHYEGEKGRTLEIEAEDKFLYHVPQRLNRNMKKEKTVLFFRSKEERGACEVFLTIDNKTIFRKKYRGLRPPEMERIEIDLTGEYLTERSKIKLFMKEVSK